MKTTTSMLTMKVKLIQSNRSAGPLALATRSLRNSFPVKARYTTLSRQPKVNLSLNYNAESSALQKYMQSVTDRMKANSCTPSTHTMHHQCRGTRV
jgi:hypothetical protein